MASLGRTIQSRIKLSYVNLGFIFGFNQLSWLLYLAVTLGRICLLARQNVQQILKHFLYFVLNSGFEKSLEFSSTLFSPFAHWK